MNWLQPNARIIADEMITQNGATRYIIDIVSGPKDPSLPRHGISINPSISEIVQNLPSIQRRDGVQDVFLPTDYDVRFRTTEQRHAGRTDIIVQDRAALGEALFRIGSAVTALEDKGDQGVICCLARPSRQSLVSCLITQDGLPWMACVETREAYSTANPHPTLRIMRPAPDCAAFHSDDIPPYPVTLDEALKEAPSVLALKMHRWFMDDVNPKLMNRFLFDGEEGTEDTRPVSTPATPRGIKKGLFVLKAKQIFWRHRMPLEPMTAILSHQPHGPVILDYRPLPDAAANDAVESELATLLERHPIDGKRIEQVGWQGRSIDYRATEQVIRIRIDPPTAHEVLEAHEAKEP